MAMNTDPELYVWHLSYTGTASWQTQWTASLTMGQGSGIHVLGRGL